MKPEKQGSQNKKSGLTLDPEDLQGTLRSIGGSASDLWNNILFNQAIGGLWMASSEEEGRDRQRTATLLALAAIGPKDELEAMMAAQLLAAHNATMECYRRAMHPEQTFQGRSEELTQANKLSRTYATLVEALNRHRGKGQQKVTVEHVHVHAGGQAVVGVVEPAGGRGEANSKDQPHAKALTDEPQQALRCADEEGKALPIAGDAKRTLPNARRPVSGRTKGQ